MSMAKKVYQTPSEVAVDLFVEENFLKTVVDGVDSEDADPIDGEW